MAALRSLPAEIAVFAGSFASQPLAFAHLLDVAPGLDLDHVEVIPLARAETRLAPYFEAGTIARLCRSAPPGDTLVLVLPGAYPDLDCPLGGSTRLRPLGPLRGTIRRFVTDPAP